MRLEEGPVFLADTRSDAIKVVIASMVSTALANLSVATAEATVEATD